MKIFWQGDKPAWEGLLKNFVCSFFYGLQTHLLMSGRFAAQKNFLSDLQSKILLSDRFYRYGDKFSRKLRYNPETLTGIIFGIRTTFDDKLKLIQKLERLGKTVRNFDFFQAEFDDETQLISVREKFLLTTAT